MEKIKNLYKKYEEIITYLFFGVVTTVVSLLACWVTLKLGVLIWHDEAGEPTEFLDILGSTVQWVVGVLVAFFTNKKWVFTNADKDVSTISQLLRFSASRLATLELDTLLTFGTVWVLRRLDYSDVTLVGITLSADLISKIVASAVVLISNYILSKIFVFKAKKSNTK